LRPNFAVPVPVPSIAGDDGTGTPEKSLVARVAVGPGTWKDIASDYLSGHDLAPGAAGSVDRGRESACS
jgi:hypothetical protein